MGLSVGRGDIHFKNINKIKRFIEKRIANFSFCVILCFEIAVGTMMTQQERAREMIEVQGIRIALKEGIEGKCVAPAEGIIDGDVDRCICNLTLIGSHGMQETDRLVLEIMTGEGC